MSKVIMGVELKERMQDAVRLQKLLSEYGCNITTRLGLHEAAADRCSRSGLILLEFVEDADAEAAKLEQELSELGGVVVKTMTF